MSAKAEMRIRKYTAKNDPAVMGLRWKAVRELSIEKWVWAVAWDWAFNLFSVDLMEYFGFKFPTRGELTYKLRRLFWCYVKGRESMARELEQDLVDEGFDPAIIPALKAIVPMAVEWAETVYTGITIQHPIPHQSLLPPKAELEAHIHAITHNFFSHMKTNTLTQTVSTQLAKQLAQVVLSAIEVRVNE